VIKVSIERKMDEGVEVAFAPGGHEANFHNPENRFFKLLSLTSPRITYSGHCRESVFHQRPLVPVVFVAGSSGIGVPATAGRATLA
jgi:hypothetical protein